MASIINNSAAWQKAAHTRPLEIGPGPRQDIVEDDDVIIKVSHVAINPIEWKVQDHLPFQIAYPTVLGSDAAGEIVRVGAKVTKFKPGDRVIGQCSGLWHGGAKHGAFQKYVTCQEITVAKIPDSVSLSEAVVLPLAISTSGTALFDNLGLEYPSLDPQHKDEFVLIWGGSSSCGTVAIQLAVAAGYNVVTTASLHNHTYMKDLGAAYVFDHHDSDVVGKINAVVGTKLAGVLDCISEKSTQEACADVLISHGGGKLAITLPPDVDVEGVETVTVWGSVPSTTNLDLGRALWGQYLPEALAAGKLRPSPEAYIITGGLDKIQDAMDMLKKGVSAKKIVVEL